MKKIYKIFVALFVLLGTVILSLPNLTANLELEPLVIGGNNIKYYGSQTNVLTPTTYTEKDSEFRATWISPVAGDIAISANNQTTAKNNVNVAFNRLVDMNFNAVIFHVRPMNDAFYDSEYAPWSRFMRGSSASYEGIDPGWDYLRYVIDLAHEKNIEFHAWMNPYRVATGSGSKESQLALLANDNFAKMHPDYVIADVTGKLILDPGRPEVREYLANVIAELLVKYSDIDGIHFDDYFYSYSGTDDNADSTSFSLFNPGGLSLANWRRKNVDLLIEAVYQQIQEFNVKNDTSIRFGISPFGIWANKSSNALGSTTAGSQSYYTQFADSRKWVLEGWVDYICPQLYWGFGKTVAGFADLVDWWAGVCEEADVDLIIGQGLYKSISGASGDAEWLNPTELTDQLNYTQKYDIIKGHSIFSYKTMLNSSAIIENSLEFLKAEYWTQKPSSVWPDLSVTEPEVSIDGTKIGSYYTGDVSITLSATHNIYYRLNHSGNWILYSDSILLDADAPNTTLECFQMRGVYKSAIAEVSILRNGDLVSNPTYEFEGTKEGDLYLGSVLLTLESSFASFYKIGEDGEWILYSNPVTLTFDGTRNLYFVSRNGLISSEEVKAVLSIDRGDFTLRTVEELKIDNTVVNYYGTSNPVFTTKDYIEKDTEVRATWVATAWNIDFPAFSSETQYKNAFMNLIATLKEKKMNTIFFQVRSMDDIFYDSQYATWSRYLTGTEGVGIAFDALEFMVDYAHQQGIEFHAWMNPYRVSSAGGSKEEQLATKANDNFGKLHPEFVMQSGEYLLLNPGEPEVREYLLNLIEEMVTLYDIDGVHFDDYFYEGSTADSEDQDAFDNHNPDSLSRANWRRENVNILIKSVYDLLEEINQNENRNLKLGVSPNAIWAAKSAAMPEGMNVGNSRSSYSAQYVDSRKWVKEGWLHYICPQIYWEFRNLATKYADCVDWWVDVVRGTGVELIIGHSISRAETDVSYGVNELARQINYNNKHPEIVGSALYSHRYITASYGAAIAIVNSSLWKKTPTTIWNDNYLDTPKYTLTGSKNSDGVFDNTVKIELFSQNDIYYKINDFGNWTLYNNSFNITNDGGAKVFVKVVDENEEASRTIMINAQIVKPNLVVPLIKVEGTKNANGSYVAGAKVTLSASSGEIWYKVNQGSNTAYQKYTGEFTLSDYGTNNGSLTIFAKALDNRGVWSSEQKLVVKIVKEEDEVVPVIPDIPDIIIEGPKEGEVYTSNVTVSFETGSDTDVVFYSSSLNGVSITTWTEYDSSFNLNKSGRYVIKYYAKSDTLGETAITTVTFDILITPVENNASVIRNGVVVNHFNTSLPVVLPTTYTEKENEIRAVWVSTVSNIDISLHTNKEAYQSEIITILENVKNNNMNTIFFQVRPMNDAFYDSEYAPWSRYVTGIEGNDPGWDILEFFIAEAHKRQIEFHAWMNPYRVSSTSGDKMAQLNALHIDNFARQNPNLVLEDTDGKLILNPGEPQVREYIFNIVNEIMAKYMLDGIHFDDYFYSYSGTSNSEDDTTFLNNNPDSLSKDDWRRENINILVRGVYNAVESFNNRGRTIKFGISPFGIWANQGSNVLGSPTAGNQSYYTQFADSRKWVTEGIVHYICPQIYWGFAHSSAPFADLVDWWAELCEEENVGLIIGQGLYRALEPVGDWNDPNELLEQIRYASKYESVLGFSFFSYKTTINSNSNIVQALDRLKNNYWKEQSGFSWKSNIKGNDDLLFGFISRDVAIITATIAGVVVLGIFSLVIGRKVRNARRNKED